MDVNNITDINDLQSTILTVAKSFVGLNLYNYHNLINKSLEMLGKKLHADKAYLFSYNFDVNTMNNDYEWCNEGVPSEMDNLFGIQITDFLDGWVNIHLKKESVIIDDVNRIDKSSKIYSILSNKEVKSLITLPIFIDNVCYGYIGFDSISNRQNWKEFESHLMIIPELFSSLIGNYQVLEQYRYMQLKAEKAADIQRDFLSKMTHEIRTPLNGVANAIYLLEETDTSDEQAQYLDIMKYSIDVLGSLVNNALDYSKSDANKLIHKSSTINLESEIIKLIEMNKYMASSKGLGLYLNYDYTLPITVKTDIEKLRQIMNNLIQNAIKYTNYGRVEVKVSLDKSHTPYTDIKFEVIDTGIGISDDNKEHIFEEFYQVGDNLNKNPQGTGLGLTIANTFVDFLKGELTVSSIEKQGSNFNFTLTLFDPNSEKRQLLDQHCLLIDFSTGDHSNVLEQLQNHFIDVEVCNLFNYKNFINNTYNSIFVYTNTDSEFCDNFKQIEKHIKKDYHNTKKVFLYDTLKSQEFVNVFEHFDASLEVPVLTERLIDSIIDRTDLSKESKEKEDDSSMKERNKILLVDDNNINRKVMAALLKGMYLEVVEAKDGYEAIEKVKTNNFKMILMDIFMPGLDGYETAVRIRELDGVKGTVPIIAVTANDVEETKEKVIETGMNGVLSKPLKKAELEQLLHEYFSTLNEESNSTDELPIFNQEDFELQFEESFLRQEIIKTFLEENETDIENIKLAFMSANCDQIHKVVHYLKGTFTYLRAERILKLSQTIIDLSRKNKINEILYLEQSLLQNYGLLAERLKSYKE